MANVKAGDTVKLKSGGPLMTIERIERDASGDPYATCSWFKGEERKRENFSLDALVPDDGVPFIG